MILIVCIFTSAWQALFFPCYVPNVINWILKLCVVKNTDHFAEKNLNNLMFHRIHLHRPPTLNNSPTRLTTPVWKHMSRSRPNFWHLPLIHYSSILECNLKKTSHKYCMFISNWQFWDLHIYSLVTYVLVPTCRY